MGLVGFFAIRRRQNSVQGLGDIDWGSLGPTTLPNKHAFVEIPSPSPNLGSGPTAPQNRGTAPKSGGCQTATASSCFNTAKMQAVNYAIAQYKLAFPGKAINHIYVDGPYLICRNGSNCAMNTALHCYVPTGCSSSPVKTGDRRFAGPGWVSVKVDMASHEITNITTIAHTLYPGVVGIDPFQTGNLGWAIFVGVGDGITFGPSPDCVLTKGFCYSTLTKR